MRKIKKFIIGALLCVCSLLCAVGAVACGEEESKKIVYKDEYLTAKDYQRIEVSYVQDGSIVLLKERVVPEVKDEHSWAVYDLTTGITVNAGYSIKAWYTDDSRQETVFPQDGTVLYGTNDYVIDIVNASGETVQSYTLHVHGVCKSSEHVWGEWAFGGNCFIEEYTGRTCSTCAKIQKKNVVKRNAHNYVNGVCDLCEKTATPTELFTFSEGETGYTLTGVQGELPEKVVLPDYYAKKPVVKVSSFAFQGKGGMKSLLVPESITEILEYAFENCPDLESVGLPDGISLGCGCFRNCTALKEFSVPYDTKTISPDLLYGCSALTSVEIPEGITEIGSGAFNGCSSLYDVNLPLTLRKIGEWAFDGCSSLESLEFPEGITELDSFSCKNLKTVSLPDSLVSLKGGFSSDKLTYNEYKYGKYLGNSSNPYVVLVSVSTDDIPNANAFEIHEDTKIIGTFAVDDGMGKLERINIPKNVVTLENIAFELVSHVEEYTVSEGNQAFKAVDGNLYTADGKTLVRYASGSEATEFTVPNGVEKIASKAFDRAVNLTKISLPDGLETIKEEAFYACRELKEIVVPDSVSLLGNAAFSACYALEKATVGKGVSSISWSLFRDCLALAEVTYNGTVAEWNALEKGDMWKDGAPFTKVVCLDGEATV
ncbi:MAG: leucine-rich repeat domain-containing protein [Clostridia bacterium]|nr:leucine-rich repeat domain-containing protein [Clostridia bacterium]